MDAKKVILEPVVTEKTNALREGANRKYVFCVDVKANKIMVMQAVKELFSVKPVACNIINVKRKTRTVRSRSGYKSGHTSEWKKAIVTLSAGDSIDIFEGA